MKESEIQKAILEWLKAKDFLVERFPLGGVLMNVGGKKFMRKNPMKGFPDLFGYFNDGRGFAIEVKTPKGRLSKEQAEWHRILKSRKVSVLVARSLDDVIKAFRPYLHLASGKPE